VYDPFQFTNKNGSGIVCLNDADGDKINDRADYCPYNFLIKEESFAKYHMVSLQSQNHKVGAMWELHSSGKSLKHVRNTQDVSLAFSKELFSGVHFYVTTIVNDSSTDGYYGIIFSYQVRM